MHRNTKGALAAAAAGALLLGGAGSLAFWTDTATVDGTSIQAGTLTISDPTCDDWQLDALGGVSGDLGDRKLVPGDSLTRTCTFDVVAEGDHLMGELDIDTPSWTGDLTSYLSPSAEFDLDGQTVQPGQAHEFEDGATTVTAEFAVTFNGDSGNASKNLRADLEDLTVQVSQIDNHR